MHDPTEKSEEEIKSYLKQEIGGITAKLFDAIDTDDFEAITKLALHLNHFTQHLAQSAAIMRMLQDMKND